MINTTILSAINTIELSSAKGVTIAEFKVENGLIRPYLSPSRTKTLSNFGISTHMYEEYTLHVLSLYFDSLQLAQNSSLEETKRLQTAFYTDLKELICIILDDSFKTIDIFPSVSSRNEFKSQCISIVSSDSSNPSYLYSSVPKPLLDFAVWVEHYFCTHASYVALIPSHERERLNSISRLCKRAERLRNSEFSIKEDLTAAQISLNALIQQNASSKKITKKESALQHIQDDLHTIHTNRESTELKIFQLKNLGVELSSYPLKEIPTIQFRNFDDTLYIYKGHIKCIREQHPIVCVNAILQTATNQPISLNVNYCTLCKQFYLSYEEYNHYLTQYKTILTKISFIANSSTKTLSVLADESPLKLCGYTVSQDKELSQSERENLLASLINHKIISKADVIQYLNWFIQMNGHRSGNSLAKEKWESDLSFVRQLNQCNQPSYSISKISSYIKK